MPTLAKPKLEDEPSVWLDPANAIFEGIEKRRSAVLGSLGFYEEHACIAGDALLAKEEGEILSEISGTLCRAANVAVRMQPNVTIATLKKLIRDPSLFFGKAFPAQIGWIIGRDYRRGEEQPETHSIDLIGEASRDGQNLHQTPSLENIRDAAKASLTRFQQTAERGRHRNEANEILAEHLGAIFLRYNDRITRHSSALGNGSAQQEGGRFYEFVEIAIEPLLQFLRARRLAPVTSASIVRRAIDIRQHV